VCSRLRVDQNAYSLPVPSIVISPYARRATFGPGHLPRAAACF
jgi:hypothetical protein